MSIAAGNETATSIVIFGASGDLTSRKLIPALFNLHCKNRLPPKTNIIGVARRDYSHEVFRDQLKETTKEFAPDVFTEEQWTTFAETLWYSRVDLDTPDDYQHLLSFLHELEDHLANRLYYLSVAPSYYATVIQSLGDLKMAVEEEGWRRVVIEKPFGYDLASAQALNRDTHAVFKEHQVYRIDHYLGKETAQNILFFRFANTIFEPIWNRNYIDHVQISVLENVDVGHRAGFYDGVGVLRDMFQNHLLQLLTLTAMEPPNSLEADALRNEKVKVLTAVHAVDLQDTVRAQYEGYIGTEKIAPDSQTPTFAALKLSIDNWRWQGVPFYLRSGKALNRKVSEILIRFKRPPLLLFGLPSDGDASPNILSICIQPDEGIHLRFEAKVPGTGRELSSVNMEFHYSNAFGSLVIPDAYERLLLDAIHGDASLFTRSDEIEAAWKIIDPILQGWQTPAAPAVAQYTQGSDGPREADALLERDDHHWRVGCQHEDC